MINREGIQKILKIILFTLIVTIVIFYSVFSFKDYFEGPEIVIFEPLNGSTFSSSTIIIKGRASRIKDISLNERPILIDKQGNFSEMTLLSPGYNIYIVSAKDKFNRTIEYKLEFVYKN